MNSKKHVTSQPKKNSTNQQKNRKAKGENKMSENKQTNPKTDEINRERLKILRGIAADSSIGLGELADGFDDPKIKSLKDAQSIPFGDNEGNTFVLRYLGFVFTVAGEMKEYAADKTDMVNNVIITGRMDFE